ncbi:cilia- and flagella-associated protein 70-like [Liolophura sinensis]|uniref:cilia- and flagella-associated protein 70-like n=1 Tax=Liolophura sinensis TaxID=3198878 RepID=UPI003158085A
MADTESSGTRPPEAVAITIVKARNLRGSKGDNLIAMTRLDFGDKVLGESAKVECTSDTPAEFNHTVSISCTYEDPLALDEIAHKPVVVTVTEVLPKEKKQKEEKTVILGQVTVDLLPLVNGETKHRYTLVINPVPGSPLEQIPAENPRPEVDVVISVNEPLLDSSQGGGGNLLTFTAESLFSPPDSWSPVGPQHTYTAALPVPISAEKETPIVFPNGQLKPSPDKEAPSKQKKWSNPGHAQGNAIYIPDSFIASDPVEDEDGDFKSKEDREHRTTSEQEKNRVMWNTERRCYMEASAVKSFQDKISKTRYWPVEIFRLPMPAAGKAGKKEEDGSIGFHGIAFINLAPLLYPGVKRIRGAYKVYAYSDLELMEKTKRKGGLADEAHKIANNILTRNSASPSHKKGKDGEKKDKENKKGASQMKSSETASEVDGQPPVNLEGQQYVEAKSYIMVEMTLSKPLVPKRPPEELAKRVSEYIPPRPLFPKRTNGAQKAVEDYHGQVASVANLVLNEFRDLFGDQLQDGQPQTDESMEARRQKLLYELNSSGKYFAFKEQLKHSVVKIVREKYLKTTNFEDRDQLQTFLSELYVYLVDQMHVALGKVLAVEDQPPIPEPLTDSQQLKHFAAEAEANGNYDLAIKYYQERIARDRNDPEHWLDYGSFCLYINDVTKAEECFKECIAVDQKHLSGLLLYAVVCTLAERFDVAETFFEAATCVQPKSIQAWTMLGLFYDAVNNEIGAEMAYLESNKLNQAAAVSAAKELQEEAEREKRAMSILRESHSDPVDSDRAGEGGLAGGALPEITESAASPDPNRAQAASAKSHTSPPRLDTRQSGPGSVVQPISSAKVKGGESASGVSRPGSSKQNITTNVSPRRDLSPEHTESPQREPTPVPSCSIFMHSIEWLLDSRALQFAERCLGHELVCLQGGPSLDYYLMFAQLKLLKHQFNLAESSLQEAILIDFQNATGWALMGHVKFMQGDMEEARDCFERTLSFVTDPLDTHPIYLRLASIYLQEGRFADAKATFLLACKKSPSCVSWLGVGIACYRLGELSEAEDALSEANILNNMDAEVWAYLSLVCLKTKRQLEAEQSYKYALKLNLQDQNLLNEIHGLQREVGFGNPEP